MHSYAFVCIRHASVCSSMHLYALLCACMPPYAAFTHSNANIQHTFPQRKQPKQQLVKIAKSVLRSGARNHTNPMQITKFVNMGKPTKIDVYLQSTLI